MPYFVFYWRGHNCGQPGCCVDLDANLTSLLRELSQFVLACYDGAGNASTAYPGAAWAADAVSGGEQASAPLGDPLEDCARHWQHQKRPAGAACKRPGTWPLASSLTADA